MTEKWIPTAVTNAIMKAWVQEGEPPEVWPLTLYDDDGNTPVKIESPADLLRQTIPQEARRRDALHS